jgi:ribokinase
MVETPSVLVLGDIMVDIVFNLNAYPREGAEALATAASHRLGGSGCTTATVLKDLGLPSQLAANLGCDAFGDFALKGVSTAGIDPGLIVTRPDIQTGFMLIAISTGGQRTMFGFRDSRLPAYPVDQIRQAAAEATWMHISGYSCLVDAQWQSTLELMRWAQAQGKPVSLDPGVEPAQRTPERLNKALPLIDYLMASDLEVKALAHSDDLEEAIAILKSNGLQTLTLKCGEQGSRIIHQDLDIHAPALAGKPVADTNGAGDCFNAGFIYACQQDYSPEHSARLGNATAYLAITSGQGIRGLQQLADLRKTVEDLAA